MSFAMNGIKYVLLGGVLGIVVLCGAPDQYVTAKDSDDNPVIAEGNKIFNQATEYLKAQDLSSKDRATIIQAVKEVRQSADTQFTEEELIAAMDMVLESFDNKLTAEMKQSLEAAMEALAKRLSKFKITGFAYAVDPNGAFIVDTQDPAFDVVFKNSAGEIKTQRFQADIESIGLKLQFSLNINLIFFIGMDLNYLNAHEKIELGYGGEVSTGWILFLINMFWQNHAARRYLLLSPWVANVMFTYAPCKRLKGSLLLVSLCLGFAGDSLSVVTGGSLTPVE
jgi:hypothetical protein